MNPQRAMLVAALLIVTGIVVGASGSHALRSLLSASQLHSLDTAVQYQLFNALGLLVIGLLWQSRADAWLARIAWMLVLGILCFSGGIYIMLAGAPRPLGFITPVGGVLMILAWVTLAWRFVRPPTSGR